MAGEWGLRARRGWHAKRAVVSPHVNIKLKADQTSKHGPYKKLLNLNSIFFFITGDSIGPTEQEWVMVQW